MAAPLPIPGDRTEGLKTIFDPATLTRKGLCPVTKLKGSDSATDSHSLYFEQHGTGPNKILFIMGLNSTAFAWLPQVKHFGSKKDYSVLVFDNRGVGNSDSPRGPYTTSAMAEDIIVLLDYVGWTAPRDLHVAGISLGGMIAQELALRIPERIMSLALIVTTAGGRPWSNLPPWKGFSSLARLMFVNPNKDPERVIATVLEMVFPVEWLDSKAEDGRTYREHQTEAYRARIAVTRPQTLMGHASQMSAALTHHVSPKSLARIGATIPKVSIVTGDNDHLVAPSNSEYLAKHITQAEFEKWEGTGHGIHTQRPERMNEFITRTIEAGKVRVADGWKPS